MNPYLSTGIYGVFNILPVAVHETAKTVTFLFHHRARGHPGNVPSMKPL